MKQFLAKAKKNILIIFMVLVLFIGIVLAVFTIIFAIKNENSLITALSSILSFISTVSIGLISFWLNYQIRKENMENLKRQNEKELISRKNMIKPYLSTTIKTIDLYQDYNLDDSYFVELHYDSQKNTLIPTISFFEEDEFYEFAIELLIVNAGANNAVDMSIDLFGLRLINNQCILKNKEFKLIIALECQDPKTNIGFEEGIGLSVSYSDIENLAKYRQTQNSYIEFGIEDQESSLFIYPYGITAPQEIEREL